MILEQLDLLAFGGFTNHTLDLSAGPRRFHVVYGPNESGKSTCLRAITALLYGVPNQTTDNYLHANAKMRIGGTLRTGDEQHLEFIRRKGRQNTVLKPDGKTALDDQVLLRVLGGVDQAAFHQRFALSHEQLIEGGKAILESQGELGEILFAAGAGVGKLRAILAQLESDERELFAARARRTIINGALSELDEKRTEMKGLQTLPASYNGLCESIEQAEQQASQIGSQIAETRQELLCNQAYEEARKIVPLWRHALERLGELAATPMLDDEFTARRREASANHDALQKSANELQSELSGSIERQKSLVLDQSILEHADQVVTLFQSAASRQSASVERSGLVGVVQDQQRQLRQTLAELDVVVAEADLFDSTSDSAVDEAIAGLQFSDSAHARITELASESEVLRQQEQVASEQVQTLKRELDDVTEELEQLTLPADPQLLEQVLGEIGPPREFLSNRDQARESHESLRRDCEQLLQQLGIAQKTLESVASLNVPSTNQIEQFEQSFGTLDRTLDQIKTEQSKQTKRRQKLESDLATLQTEHDLPSEQSLVDAREHRDQMLDQWIAASTDEQRLQAAQNTRKGIRASDQIVDALRLHQQKVIKADAIRSELVQLQDSMKQLDVELTSTLAEHAETTKGWESLWQDEGIAPGTTNEMRQWIARYQSLVERIGSLAQSQSQLDRFDEKQSRMTERLGNAVKLAWSQRNVSSGSEDASRPDLGDLPLESLHDLATGLRSELNRALLRHNQLLEKKNELTSTLPAAQTKHEFCRNRRQEWDEAWKLATSKIIREENATPAVINARIKRINDLLQLKRDRDSTLQRIRTLDRDQQTYEQQVNSMLELTEHPRQDRDQAAELARSLYERLQQAQASQQEHKRVAESVHSLQNKLTKLNENLQSASSVLDQLRREAGVDTVDELPMVERSAAEKRRVQQEFENAKRQLVMLAGKTDPEAFATHVESLDQGELSEKLESLQTELKRLSTQRTEIEQQIGGLKQDRRRIDGSDRAASLNQDVQMILGRISHHAERWAKLRIASMVMRQAIDHYRRANESPVLKIACDAFSKLTLGRYSGLRPEYDDKDRWALVGVRTGSDGSEQTVPVELMSDGTRDSVFLAMRLASIEHQLSSGRTFPVIVDDCLIQLDDARAAAGLKLFSELSTKTQVLMFTHHEHVLELANDVLDQDAYHPHRLPT
ncbi:YhaN family protein [Rhodopirellula sp. MGV]|uniref:YhaN family protein n=1 Tax=Rhodopirellula sp. MGV TaxID=2023130 RepID=UPI0013040DD6|nr:YhaN family protein [Rhodopirellula sp. MGV]